ncbi:uncharacterized protein QC761_111888 [Podospora bellae-mahoneyi]|uniref:Uncharacterized protein n=1 Tax=Podospora bellae-mahoneyi TaxID=2093777 RepID=A0ABR0FXE8_9PEZI|nr:hypothetical protein QC761_111888 [Podospora bellae-mahoneyi]
MTQQSCSDLVNHHEQEPFYEVPNKAISSPIRHKSQPPTHNYTHPLPHNRPQTRYNHSHKQPLSHNHAHTTTLTQPLSHVPALLHIEPNTTTTNTSRYHDTPFSILNRVFPPKQSHYPV